MGRELVFACAALSLLSALSCIQSQSTAKHVPRPLRGRLIEGADGSIESFQGGIFEADCSTVFCSVDILPLANFLGARITQILSGKASSGEL